MTQRHTNNNAKRTSFWGWKSGKALSNVLRADDVEAVREWVEEKNDIVITRLLGYPYTAQSLAYAAIASGAEKITKYVILEQKRRGIDINRKAWGDWTLLDVAEFFQQDNIVAFLRENGAEERKTLFNAHPVDITRYMTTHLAN